MRRAFERAPARDLRGLARARPETSHNPKRAPHPPGRRGPVQQLRDSLVRLHSDDASSLLRYVLASSTNGSKAPLRRARARRKRTANGADGACRVVDRAPRLGRCAKQAGQETRRGARRTRAHVRRIPKAAPMSNDGVAAEVGARPLCGRCQVLVDRGGFCTDCTPVIEAALRALRAESRCGLHAQLPCPCPRCADSYAVGYAEGSGDEMMNRANRRARWGFAMLWALLALAGWIIGARLW